MVAPKNCDSLPESYFQSHQQSYLESTYNMRGKQKQVVICHDKAMYRMETDRFDTVVASVDIVAHEEVICVWRFPSNTEKLHKVVELTVYVAAYSHRTFHLMIIQM